MKMCPKCAETDLAEAATVCKHCGYDFAADTPMREVIRGLGVLLVIIVVVALVAQAW